MCKKIHRGGNAEQYHADKKYKEAVAVAVEACAEDVKGQTCYICTQALHWKTKEGLVRMCACRGTAGFAHVTCLAEQAKILVAEAEENNLGYKVSFERWGRWSGCSLCEQNYHGVVAGALGWACWKTYAGRPDRNWVRGTAMNVLGSGLSSARHDEDALTVREALLSMMRRFGASEEDVLVVQGNLACSYNRLGRREEALRIERDVYSGWLKLNGEENGMTLAAANNYADSLLRLQRFADALWLWRKTIPVARRVLGEGNETTLTMRCNYAQALLNQSSTLADLREAVTTLEDARRIARRVLGGAHPRTVEIERSLQTAVDASTLKTQMVAREAVMAAAIADMRVYKAEIAANEAQIAANEAAIRALEMSPPGDA
ncbi:unnamed protein product [Pelagomonas calceolata]|uniref:RING-CH-type domain-containing protein n=1 Tax=Pelagomonas calceolata TaxID=35677 RepID=A0A8J2SBW1_9STRA|nr:unnamed protein product [Pelagomonas calceolata]